VARLVLLVTSPRLPAGLLTAEAWDLVRTRRVFAGAESEQTTALRAAGVDLTVLTEIQIEDVVSALLAAAGEHGTAVWLAAPQAFEAPGSDAPGSDAPGSDAPGSEGPGSQTPGSQTPGSRAPDLQAADDGALARALGLRLARSPGLGELELCYGSWDPPGARLLDLVAVIDRLSSPGGDPWKLAQTHQSLARFLLEEAYEAYDAIDAHDLDALRGELGDVLLQVVLHSRMAEDAEPSWSIDDVAADQVAKQIRRNPHVFAGLEVAGIDEITANWERIKQTEKQGSSTLDGIAWSQPALALATKVIQRARLTADPVPGITEPTTEDQLGELLFALVAAAVQRGLDPEAALRRAVQTAVQAAGQAAGQV
jgi:XTP/dITP diphosphohydrolase